MTVEFNEQQMKVINHIDGPLLCIAGPGSGKTTSIIQRVVNMTENGVNPYSILVVTFTKAAADDMKNKYENKPGAKPGVTFGTIHSLCFSILKKYDPERYSRNCVLSDADQREFIRTQLRPLHIEWIDQDYIINGIIGAISSIKNNGVNPNDIEVDGCSNKKFIEIFNEYEEFKATNSKIDYDDMLFMTNKLFEKDHTLLDEWRDKFEYLIIDEFQDTNELQAKILYDIAYPRNNICIIGDDDQSIYMFRGAVPRIMLEFENQFPGCEKVILNKNYRSEPEIVAATRRLIEHNEVRFDKPLEAAKQGVGKITHISTKNRDREISQIVKDLRARQKLGIPLDEVAILYRTNNQAAQLAQALIKANIPFYTYELVVSIYDHWIFRDIKMFKKVVDGTCSINEFLMIINRPNKYVSRKILPLTYSEKGVINASAKMGADWQRKKMFEQLSDWYAWIHDMEKMKPAEFIATIRKHLEYDKFIKDYAEQNKLDKSQFLDVLNELQDSAEPFDTFDAWMAFAEKELVEFKEKMKSKKKEDSVVLLTMHRSKGLEWEDVIIIDANEEITPYYKAEEDDELEEERRMFYVAATRAKKNLTIYSIEKRNTTEMAVSRFVKEMMSEKVDREKAIQEQLKTATPTTQFHHGDWVFHKTFGLGMVTVVDATVITIAFNNAGIKRLGKDWCTENLQLF